MNRNKLKKDGNLIKTLNARHKRKRNKNTLKELAKSFLEYMKEENGKVLKIDDIVKKLEFSKRRIYDITNVLEGIGIIKKIEKNKIEIISKQSLDSESIYERVNSEMESLLDEEIELKKEEKKLDIWINELMNTYYENSKSEEFKKMCFLNLDHIKSIGDKKDLNIVGINAPKNTKIVVPDPNCLESLYNEKIKDVKCQLSKITSHDNELLKMLSRKHHLYMESPEDCDSEIKIFMLLSSNTFSY